MQDKILCRIVSPIAHHPSHASSDQSPADQISNDLLLYVLMPLPGVLILWISYLVGLLWDAFIEQGGMTLVFAYYGFIMMMYMFSLITLGHTATTITTCIAILGHNRFLGFSKCIYDSYREIPSVRYARSKLFVFVFFLNFTFSCFSCSMHVSVFCITCFIWEQ